MKKRRIKWRAVNSFALIIVFLVIVSISVFSIIKWNIDSNKSNNETQELQGVTNIENVEDSENTEIIENDVPKENPYWDYIKMNLIDVDFKNLKEINSDTVGWIQVNGTNINYPFVQASDNDYYLNHSFKKNNNDAGWVFMDYRNSKDTIDQNTILYAHGRRDNTMFGTLKNILSSKWINNTDNYVVKLSTERYNALYQVFSIYNIPETSDYLQIHFNDEDFMKFANMLIDRSDYNFNTTLKENDKILTLSTCYNMTNRVVLHAKLIKIEKKGEI